jgi:hypothetical protein
MPSPTKEKESVAEACHTEVKHKYEEKCDSAMPLKRRVRQQPEVVPAIHHEHLKKFPPRRIPNPKEEE